jgi:L-lactate dehydrogenase (cytochrome)
VLTTLAVITKHAGLDASSSYNAVHSPSLISKTLGPSKCKGTIDSRTDVHLLKPPPTEDAQPALRIGAKPPLSSLINSYDFEAVAEKTLTKKAWAFYSSAATNLVTRDANKSMFDRVWFRPRLLRNIRHIDTSTSILGQTVKLPLFISPAAMARLAHPDGELALARGAEKFGIAQCVCSNQDASGLCSEKSADMCRFQRTLHTHWRRSHHAYIQNQSLSSSSFMSTKTVLLQRSC